MSVSSDRFEEDVAKNINYAIKALDPKGKAKRSTRGTAFSDVEMEVFGKRAWCEVKMSHTDNLSNPRVFYHSGKWQTTYDTPVAKQAVEILNESAQARDFVADLAKFSGIPLKSIKIPTTKTGLREPGAVPLHVMKAYFGGEAQNRYIAEEKNYNLGKLVTEHYTAGKREPAYYMQAGDDFYLISKENPLGMGGGIPQLKGTGDFKVRVATRSEFYEVQTEIKIKDMGRSLFSIKPNTNKKNPFDTIR